MNFNKQLVSSAIGIALLFFLSFYDYRVLNLYATKLYFVGIILLLFVVVWGTTVRGTTGWIGFGAFHIQPVEIVKLIMVIFLAVFFGKKGTQLSIMVRIMASIVLVLVPVFLILKQPDFGSAMIVLGSWSMLLLLSGIDKKNLFLLVLGATVVFSSSWFFFKDYQKARIVSFIDPGRDPRGSGYNVIQSMVAVGSGNVFGKGIGRGSQSQLNFLPEKHTDFIFAVIAEELGFLGASIVFVLFGVIFYRMKEIAKASRDNFGYLMTMGIVFVLFLQVLVNIGMNIGMAPVAGVPLPFVSYGGSSLVLVLASIGLVQSVYLRREKQLD
jgi:rod shape determining protein RodA